MGQTRRNFEGIPGLGMCRGHRLREQVFFVPSDFSEDHSVTFRHITLACVVIGSDKLRNVSRERLRATK